MSPVSSTIYSPSPHPLSVEHRENPYELTTILFMITRSICFSMPTLALLGNAAIPPLQFLWHSTCFEPSTKWRSQGNSIMVRSSIDIGTMHIAQTMHNVRPHSLSLSLSDAKLIIGHQPNWPTWSFAPQSGGAADASSDDGISSVSAWHRSLCLCLKLR